MGKVGITTTQDTELPPVVITLFGITIALGLVAIGVVALNVVLLLKTMKSNVSQSRMRERRPTTSIQQEASCLRFATRNGVERALGYT